MTAFLNQYIENEDTSVNYLSARSARESAEGERAMINFVGGLVGVIFGIAGILNLINMMAMQSIGMTARQLTKMMIYESVCYASGACLSGIAAAALLDLTLIRNLLGSMWHFTFRFTLVPAFAVSVILMIVSVIVPVLALRFFNKGSIVEQLRVAE